MTQVSIIIPCKNEGKRIKETIESILSTPCRIPFDITVVNDDSTDGCCAFLNKSKNYPGVKLINTNGVGAANARNLGVKKCTGEILVFCDAHITVEPEWLEILAEGLLERGAGAVSPGIANMGMTHAIGYGMTWNKKLEAQWLPSTGEITEVPIAPGGCVAVTRRVFNDVEGFETGFRTYGFEDAEFSMKLWLFGYRVEVDPAVVVEHHFRSKHPYPITMEEYAYNGIRMAFSHFNWQRAGQVINMYNYLKDIGMLVSELVLESNILKQRERYLKRRKYNDDWFINKFQIPL
ncbi:glycosyltransferase family 2 protein [Desulfotomaculum sp. 1211_IL3151]|uniref:glycosyltransferase family 2 protein n=1 Tax=Desulfotomaculum sp. 1211_IL3151 TaxID=3084055 RepID=UPI002FDA7FD4